MARTGSKETSAHLTEETPLENSRAGGGLAAVNLAKDTCVNGHPLPEYVNGRRPCVPCRRESAKRSNDLIRAARQVLGLSQSQYQRLYGSRGAATARAVLASVDGST